MGAVVPVSTHLFLVGLPIAIAAAAVLHFLLRGRRRGR